MRYIVFILFIFISSPLKLTATVPVEPASSTETLNRNKKYGKATFKLKKNKRPTISQEKSSYVVFLLLLLPAAGLGMFIAGLLSSIFGLWLSGLLIWAISVLLSSAIFFLIALDLIKRKYSPNIGFGGILLSLIWLYILIITFIFGLIPLSWGLVAGIQIMWVAAAIAVTYALLLSMIGYFIFRKL